MVWKMIFLFQGCILRFHVKLQGCIWNQPKECTILRKNHLFFRGLTVTNFMGRIFQNMGVIWVLGRYSLEILVGGWSNPYEKYWSNWIISPGENKNDWNHHQYCMKPTQTMPYFRRKSFKNYPHICINFDSLFKKNGNFMILTVCFFNTGWPTTTLLSVIPSCP